MNENIDHHSNGDTYNYENSISIVSLEKMLIKYDIPFEYYSLNGYQEEALCLEQINFNWVIYYAERGRKYEEMTFNNIDRACIEIIKRLSLNESKERIMINEYKQTKEDHYKKLYEVLDLKNDKTFKEKKITINKKRKIQTEVKEKLKYLAGFSAIRDNFILDFCVTNMDAISYKYTANNIDITEEEWLNLEMFFMMRQKEFLIDDKNYKICSNLVTYSQRKDAGKIKEYLQTIGKEGIRILLNAGTNVVDAVAMETVKTILQKILKLNG